MINIIHQQERTVSTSKLCQSCVQVEVIVLVKKDSQSDLVMVPKKAAVTRSGLSVADE